MNVVVSTFELAALHHAKRLVRWLLNLGMEPDRVGLILNRVPRTPLMSLEELHNLIGVPIIQTITNNYQQVNEAYEEGRLIDRKSKLGREIQTLAEKTATLMTGLHVSSPVPAP